MPAPCRTVAVAGRERPYFATPPALAAHIADLLATDSWRPRSLLDPVCGSGALLRACQLRFPGCRHILGLDVQDACVQATAAALRRPALPHQRLRFARHDALGDGWSALCADLSEPILLVANPPWSAQGGAGDGALLFVERLRAALAGRRSRLAFVLRPASARVAAQRAAHPPQLLTLPAELCPASIGEASLLIDAGPSPAGLPASTRSRSSSLAAEEYSVLGHPGARRLVAKAVACLPEEIASDLLGRCRFLMPGAATPAFLASPRLTEGRTLVVLAEALLQMPRHLAVHIVLHELAHLHLGHRIGRIEGLDTAGHRRQEREADALARRWHAASGTGERGSAIVSP